MVQVLGNVKDERCFNSLTLCKYPSCAIDYTTNLGLVVIMFSQKFYTLQNFPYVKVFEH
jgi:hypothetical protein